MVSRMDDVQDGWCQNRCRPGWKLLRMDGVQDVVDTIYPLLCDSAVINRNNSNFQYAINH